MTVMMIFAQREGGRRMSSGLLVEGEDIGGGVSWSTISLGEIIFLYGAATDSYVEHFGDGSLEAKKTTKASQSSRNGVGLFDI